MKTIKKTIEKPIEKEVLTVYVCEVCGKEDTSAWNIKRCEKIHLQDACDHEGSTYEDDICRVGEEEYNHDFYKFCPKCSKFFDDINLCAWSDSPEKIEAVYNLMKNWGK